MDWWMWPALVALSFVAVLLFKREAQAEGPTTPPPERPPDHEVTAAIADIRAAIDRLQITLEKQHVHHEDELRDIKRTLDRIEASRRAEESDRRLEDLLSRIARQQKET